MTDAHDQAPQPSKPSRLSGLVAPKGAAARPGESSPPAPAEVAPPPTAPKTAPDAMPVREQPAASAPLPAAAPTGTGSKSLTLRLPDAEYERLRAHAYATRKSHQAILAEALRQYLENLTQ